MRFKCFECKKIFVTDGFLKKHINTAHPKSTEVPKSKGWATSYGFADFTKPVTYEEACEQMKKMYSQMFDKTEVE